MNILKTLLILTIALSSMTVMAADEKSIDQMLSSLRLEKMQAESMIEKMEKRGRMNSDEAGRAKREIASVKEDDKEIIKTQAFERLNSKKSFATK